MSTFYRIHSAAEPVETVLNPARPDGWVASDEDLATQPHGVACCDSVESLRRYIRLYSLTAQPGDVVLEMSGRYSHDDDRDQHAVRAIVSEVVAVHPLSILDEPTEDEDEEIDA